MFNNINFIFASLQKHQKKQLVAL